MDVDYLIVGQGLAGSVFAWKAIKASKTVKIYDTGSGSTSTRVAAGIVNPVTGRNNRLSWKADIMIPYALDFYKGIQEDLNVRIVHELPILKLLQDTRTRNEWDSLSGEQGYNTFLTQAKDAGDLPVIAQGGIGEIRNGFRVDTVSFLDSMRMFFKENEALIESHFDYNLLNIQLDGIEYEEYKSKHIVFCEGFLIRNNPYFIKIPHTVAKGEVMIIEMEGGFPDAMLNKNGYIVPFGKTTYCLGATNDWSADTLDITEEGRKELLLKIAAITKLPYTIIDHQAGVRPTSKDRYPIIGKHPEHPPIAVFNGLGSKGISLAPFFAQQLLDHVDRNEPIWKEVNLKRFFK